MKLTSQASSQATQSHSTHKILLHCLILSIWLFSTKCSAWCGPETAIDSLESSALIMDKSIVVIQEEMNDELDDGNINAARQLADNANAINAQMVKLNTYIDEYDGPCPPTVAELESDPVDDQLQPVTEPVTESV